MRRLIPFLLMAASTVAVGQTFPTTQDSGPPVALGAEFESRAAGVSFLPPAGGTLIHQPSGGDIVRFVYPSRNWDLHVKMTTSSQPIALATTPNATAGDGLLDLTAGQIKATDPKAEIVLQNIMKIGSYDVGRISARTMIGSDRAFAQQAIFQANPQRYYVFQLTAGVGAANEAAATTAFDLMLSTVHLEDLSGLAREQNLRLMEAHHFYDVLDEKRIVAAMVPDQWMRVIRDGRDAGFIEETDLPANHFGHDGMEITLRSHIESQPASAEVSSPATAPAGLVKTERVAKFFVTFERRHEDWSVITAITDGSATHSFSEIGNSDQETHEHLDADAIRRHQMGDATDPKQPPVYQEKRYTLSVSTYIDNKASPPIERTLSSFYLPLALSDLLPRLLPLDDPEMYMFASYVNDEHEVMARYVDVSGQEDVTLDGQAVHAVLVKDRIGVDGSTTTYYLTPAGKWLGTTNDDQKLLILPSDAQSMIRLWHVQVEPAAPAGR